MAHQAGTIIPTVTKKQPPLPQVIKK